MMANEKRMDDTWERIRAIATRVYPHLSLSFFVLDEEEIEEILISLESREEYKTIDVDDVSKDGNKRSRFN